MRYVSFRIGGRASYGLQRDLRFGITADDLGLLSPEARGRLVAPGSLSGTAKAYVADEAGNEVVLSTIPAGDYFGEVTLDGSPRSASAIGPTTSINSALQW